MRISFERRCSKSAERRKIFIFIVTIVPHLGGGAMTIFVVAGCCGGGVAGDGGCEVQSQG